MTSTSELLVEESTNGISYTTVINLAGTSNLPSSCTIKGPYNLNSNSRYVKWTFTKGSSNMTMDDVEITKATSTGPTITVTQATGGNISPDTASYAAGADQSFTATPDACHAFSNWIIDAATSSTANPYTFTNISANHTLTAVYNSYDYNITATSGPNGSITPSGITSVSCGANQSYTITAASGYAIDDVLVDGASLGAVSIYNFINVTAPRTISATFNVYVGPCLGEESFESGEPTGWTNNGSYYNTGDARSGNQKAGMNDLGDWIQMLSIDNPSSLVYYARLSSNPTGTNSVKIQYWSGTDWTDIIEHTATSEVYTIFTVDLSSLTSLINVQLRFFRSAHNRSIYIDDVSIFCGTPTPEPEIAIQGNGNEIVNGDSSPDSSDATYFGNVALAGGTQDNIFTINNTGTANLDITSVTSSNASEFMVSGATSGSISPSSSATFTVTFDPNAIGLSTATITVTSDDSDEGTYTFTISGNGTNSNLSTIIDNTNYGSTAPEFNSNPEYINFIDGSATSVGKFIPMKIRILDGPDADGFDTTLTNLSLTVEDVSNTNQLAMIKTALLTTTGGTVLATATKVANALVFSGMSGAAVTAPDDNLSGRILHIRASFDETQVVDRTKLIFKITSATADPTGSSFVAADAGGAQSSTGNNSQNRLNVTADRLSFVQQPSDTDTNATMTPAVLIEGIDMYAHRDLDYTTTIQIGSTGTMTSSPLSATAINGVASFNTIVHSVAENNRQLTAVRSGTLDWTATSSSFNITDLPTSNGDYRTTGSGNWNSNTIWERFTGGTWSSSTAPSYASVNRLYIRNGHTITTSGAFGSSVKLYILDGGTFINIHNSTAQQVFIYEGGTLDIRESLSIASSGTIEVFDGGMVYFDDRGNSNLTTSLWNGTENFHPLSELYITDFNPNAYLFNGEVTLNTYNGYTAAFGNVYVDYTNSVTGASPAEDWESVLGPNANDKNLCHNNFEFVSTRGNEKFQFIQNNDVVAGIGGDLILRSGIGSARRIVMATGNADLVLNINGNIELDCAGDFALRGGNSAAGSCTVNVDGNILVNGSNVTSNTQLRMNTTIYSIANGGMHIINLKGDLLITDAEIDNITPRDDVEFNFVGNTVQSVNIKSIVGNSSSEKGIPFYIKNGAKVLLTENNLRLNRSSLIKVESGGTLNFGFGLDGITPLLVTQPTSPSGSNLFELEEGGILKITHSQGISSLSTAGNVQLSASNKTFNQTATFHYIGKENQVTGNALLPGSSEKLVFVNLSNNSNTLILSNDVGISDATTLDLNGGKLEIQRGSVVGSSTGDFYGSGRLVMTNGEYRISTITASPLTDFLPRLGSTAGLPGIGGYANYELSGGIVNLDGSNATQILSGTPHYFNLKFSGTNDYGPPPFPILNYKGLSTATKVSNNITISNNAIVDVRNNSLGLGNNPSFTMNDSSRYVTDGGGEKPDTAGVYSLDINSTIEYANTTGAGIVRLGLSPIQYANIVISGTNVSNNSNVTGILLKNGGTFTVKDGATFKLKNTAGFSGAVNTAIRNTNSPTVTLEDFSTIEYTGTDQNITSFSPEYKNISISGTGTKTLGHPTDILVGEDLMVKSGSLLVKTDEAITVDERVIVDNTASFNIENSGSLIQINDTKTNIGKISMIRKASIKNLDYVYWSAPINGYNVSNISPTTHIYKWDATATNANNTQGNWIQAIGETMLPGKGYIVRAPNGQADPSPAGSLNFTTTFYDVGAGSSVPNNGEISIDIFRGDNTISDADTDDNWNLLGNPYPSAISIMDFLSQNLTVDGYVNLWKHGLPPNSSISPFYQNFSLNYNQSDYFYYNSSGSSDGPDSFSGFIAAGQGFMVNMVDGQLPDTTNVIFRNNMRDKAYVNNEFFRTSQNQMSSQEKHRIWLDLISPTTSTNRILVGYIEGATMPRDRMFDAPISFDAATEGIYSLINDESYIIQGRALAFDENDIIQLGIKVNAPENYTIAIGAVDGLFESNAQTIYLRDELLGFTHNLTNQPYSFTSEAGVFNDRFEIVFNPAALSTYQNEISAEGLLIMELKDGRVRFSVDKNLNIKNIEILDLLGRRLYNLKANNSSEIFELSNLSQSTYFAKATLSNGQVILKKAIKQQ
ncbi:choice-of-anchor D domain-containing protein [Subsaximicrobium wynnwilliamsii]|uniref:choice-of-anchor D domain-containing protein n=1 Tax=Subsaximicrobium wynnwilliamsii TaxID=291179 RepID=UPI00167507DD|nr:choice-of-anchor D domain-containing protein [Subsaximicrobium wynnwilliamsii]